MRLHLAIERPHAVVVSTALAPFDPEVAQRWHSGGTVRPASTPSTGASHHAAIHVTLRLQSRDAAPHELAGWGELECGDGASSSEPEDEGDVTLLLAGGASISQVDACGKTPMHYAAVGFDVSVLELLLGSPSASETCSLHDKAGATALHDALRAGKACAMNARALIAKGGASLSTAVRTLTRWDHAPRAEPVPLSHPSCWKTECFVSLLVSGSPHLHLGLPCLLPS